MTLPQSLGDSLEQLLARGRVAIYERGSRLGGLEPFQYEVRELGDVVLLHLWSEDRTLVRRVTRIVQEDDTQLTLEASGYGAKRPEKLALTVEDAPRAAMRIAREQFALRFRNLLAETFPDDDLKSLTMAADLKYSLSGNYVRGKLENGAHTWAVIGAAPEETAATYDAALTSGLLWMDRLRETSRETTIRGLRIFLPENTASLTAHRLQGLSPAVAVRLYSYNSESWRARAMDPRDTGNIETWLAPRRESEAIRAEASEALDAICALVPNAIEASVVPGTKEVALRFHGLIFARWTRQGMFFGAGDPQQALTPDRQVAFRKLVRELETHRSPVSSLVHHALYRAQPERWLASLAATQPDKIDARLDPNFIYAQVPALSTGDRSLMDLVGCTRSGRLAVIELKVTEDPQLVLQAVDYWLRVRWHHAQGDFTRFGYFPGIALDPRPPLLILVAPAIRFHPANDVMLRYLNPEIEICRVGVSESWRRGLKVVLRQN